MKIATAAVIQHQNKILLAHRMKDNRWELPGGKIDPGETPEQCVVREVREELAIDISVDRLICEIEGTFRQIPMRVYGFLAGWKDGELAMVEVHHQVKWIDFEQYVRFDLVEEDVEILKQLQQQGYPANRTPRP